MCRKKLDEVIITRAIIDTFHKRFLADLNVDVAVIGGGPSGLMAAAEIAKKGRKTALFERKLSLGGGMWGGGIGYNVCVFQEESKRILDTIGVKTEEYVPGYFTCSSVELSAALILEAVHSGVSIYNLLSVEDVMVENNRINGIVVNKSSIEMASLHVDPICIGAKYTIDATGHAAEVVQIVSRKSGVPLNTPSGRIEGEKSMNAEMAESSIIENTVEIAPGLLVTGMAANACMGSNRMGAIFGGMLLSGEKAAKMINEFLSNK